MKDDGSYPWDHSTIPAANGTKYCYMYTNAVTLDDFYGIPKELKQAIDDGKSMATFLLKDRKGFNRQIAEYIGNAFPVEDGYVGFSEAYSLNGEVVYKYTIERYGNGGGANSISPEVLAKLEGLIAEANGYGGIDDGFDEADNADIISGSDLADAPSPEKFADVQDAAC